MIYPLGTFHGIPVMVDTEMPNDRWRFVDPRTGQKTDYILPESVEPKPFQSVGSIREPLD